MLLSKSSVAFNQLMLGRSLRHISMSAQSLGGHGPKHGEKIIIDIDDPTIPPIPPPPSYANYHEHPTHPIFGENPGPPITLDYVPVPALKYAEEYPRLQRKFNLFILVSFSMLCVTMAIACVSGGFTYYAWGPLESTKDRFKYAAMQEEKKKNNSS